MRSVKVSEAEGPVLDWLVAQCEVAAGHLKDVQVDPEFGLIELSPCKDWHVALKFSTAWNQGGPIIEREGIDLYCNVPSSIASRNNGWLSAWRAAYRRCGFGTDMSYGPTPLIAALRCYVASKLGEEVEVPDGIT